MNFFIDSCQLHYGTMLVINFFLFELGPEQQSTKRPLRSRSWGVWENHFPFFPVLSYYKIELFPLLFVCTNENKNDFTEVIPDFFLSWSCLNTCKWLSLIPAPEIQLVTSGNQQHMIRRMKSQWCNHSFIRWCVNFTITSLQKHSLVRKTDKMWIPCTHFSLWQRANAWNISF